VGTFILGVYSGMTCHNMSCQHSITVHILVHGGSGDALTWYRALLMKGHNEATWVHSTVGPYLYKCHNLIKTSRRFLWSNGEQLSKLNGTSTRLLVGPTYKYFVLPGLPKKDYQYSFSEIIYLSSDWREWLEWAMLPINFPVATTLWLLTEKR